MHPFPSPSQKLSFSSFYLVIRAFVVSSYIFLVSTSGASASSSKRKYIPHLLRARERFYTRFSQFLKIAIPFPTKTHHSPALDPSSPLLIPNLPTLPLFFPHALSKTASTKHKLVSSSVLLTCKLIHLNFYFW